MAKKEINLFMKKDGYEIQSSSAASLIWGWGGPPQPESGCPGSSPDLRVGLP